MNDDGLIDPYPEVAAPAAAAPAAALSSGFRLSDIPTPVYVTFGFGITALYFLLRKPR